MFYVDTFRLNFVGFTYVVMCWRYSVNKWRNSAVFCMQKTDERSM